MIIKCKMCGGDLEFQPGATYGTCEYCGSTSTIPQADDEGKLNRYNRANHFRRQCEFDKAVTAYEKLLEQDDTDAEAHWDAVISRYGIEYVEDPDTKKRIPTCHRVQVASILADADYLAAVENAPDAASRDLYKQQAAEIAEIQKGILAISANEKPYDVFICYKETDEQGQRTRDSQWAQDVYYGLTEQGYKVFFSRITLEDKLGQQYEPYIFAALNSARVMVVIGSKPEYFNAVWVKNEWSRYLALMAKDRKRLLIPCYRGMDPYDLPEELSTLQSQDMSKIGFMQDLLRGIKKVLDADKQPEQPKVVQQVVQTNAAAGVAPGISSLMERTYLFMEDGDFDSAAEYLNRVLDIDPKFAPAYAAKVCVAFRIRKEAGLADTTFQYEDNPDWQKALRFADAQQKAVYEGYAAKVKERVTRQIRDYAYDCAMEMAVLPGADRGKLDAELAAYKASCTRSNGNRANGSRRQNRQLNENAFKQAVRSNEPGDVSEQGFKTAADMFDAINDSEATECAKQCRTLAEQARQKKIYLGAIDAHKNQCWSPIGLEEAAKAFMSIPEYKDAKAQAQKCVDEAEAIRDSRYSNAVTAMKEAGDSSIKWEKAKNELADSGLTNYRDVEQLRTQAAKRYDECVAAEQEARRQKEEKARREAEAAAEAAAAKKKRSTILGILAAMAVVAAVLVVTLVIIPGNHYKKAEALLAAGEYDAASEAFANAGSYSDAAQRVLEPYYVQAEALLATGEYEAASEAFANAGSYSDAAQRVGEPYYVQAEVLLAEGQYQAASEAFANAGNYSDAAERVGEPYYVQAEALLAAGDQIGAADAFLRAGDYQDAAERSKELYYAQAEALLAAGDQDGAAQAFAKAVGYQDALKQCYNLRYALEEGSVAAGFWHTVGLKRDGTVVAVGDNDEGQCDVSSWTDIVAVAAGLSHTVGLKRNGTVVAVGMNSSGQCDVSSWTDIVAVASGYHHTVGLKRDGTVVAVGNNEYNQCDVSSWNDIVAVTAGSSHTVGLKRDGTVVAVGYNDDGQCDVSSWSDIVAVATGAYHTVGLKRDGTVVAVGNNEDNRCDVSSWTDIVAVAAGGSHTVGLKRDGTVVAVGYNDDGQCDVSSWSDIVAVAAGGRHTVGLKRDGTVVAVGNNWYGQRNVSGWTDIGCGLTLD